MAHPRLGTWLTCPRASALVLSGALWLAPFPASAAPGTSVSLDDPAGDDRGPGHYVYPSGSRFARGAFDLRRFEVVPHGEYTELRVTVARPAQKPIEARVSDAQAIALDNGIYVQNIDVYVDMTPGMGQVEGLPGRRIGFHPDQGWELAVALTPLPYAARAVIEDWGLAGTQVYVPADVYHEGPTFVARVPHDRLGGPPQASWGWAVTVSGATWEKSFAVLDRITDRHRLDAFTLPVHTVAQDDAFGGGTIGGLHPQVIDILTPAGLSQKQLLSAHDAETQRFATVAMVYPDPEAAAAAGHAVQLPLAPTGAGGATTPEKAPVARIRDVLETTVVIVDPPDGLAPYTLVEVRDGEGARVGKLVITAIRSEFVTATVVEGLGAIRQGMTIHVPAKAPPATETPAAPRPEDAQE